MTNTPDWECQLASIAESDHMDSATMADLGVSYAATTGDESLIECFTIFEQLFTNRLLYTGGSGSFSQRGPRTTSWTGISEHRERCGSSSYSGSYWYYDSQSRTARWYMIASSSRSGLHSQSWSESWHGLQARS